MIDDSEMLFRRIKNVALKKPHRSKRFMDFVRGMSGKETFHHVFGSLGSLKSSDLLGVGLNGDEHSIIEGERDKLIEQIPGAIENLLKYTKLLEEENKMLRKGG